MQTLKLMTQFSKIRKEEILQRTVDVCAYC